MSLVYVKGEPTFIAGMSDFKKELRELEPEMLLVLNELFEEFKDQFEEALEDIPVSPKAKQITKGLEELEKVVNNFIDA